jgi:hypothetical protein
LELIVQDKTTKRITGDLFGSEKTVWNHISNERCILRKLNFKIHTKGLWCQRPFFFIHRVIRLFLEKITNCEVYL